ncbi:uncharacterized protein PEZ65_016810 [Lycodopsis pacificus]
MIATGGLLRINARRQDSLRSKAHKAHTHKRKKKNKRNEVVVVKGKLKLFSVSGLVAALGVLVLLVGVVMAALGYWPRDGLFFSAQPQEATAMQVSSSRDTPAEAQVRSRTTPSLSGFGGGGVNQTETINGTTGRLPRGFLEDFLDRYLCSDRLKVLGPLIMGIGIFLFICANAVLHENRDKKTKVINLRDIYSTVIDLHGLRQPNPASSSTRRSLANPLNGLVNYVQSKSLEAKPRAYPASLLNRREGGGSGGGGGDTVFSIYQEQPDALPPPTSSSSSSSYRLSLPPSFSPPHLSTCWTSLQKEARSSFTLPLRRPRSSAAPRRHSAWAGVGHRGEEEEEEELACPPLLPPLCSSTPAASCSSSSLQKEVLLLLSSSSLTPSYLSLSSLSHLLSSSSSTPVPPLRRRSLPTGGGGGAVASGYSKLTHGEDQSFESTEMTSSHHVTSHRKYSNREKLRMISQADSGSMQTEEEGRPIGRPTL